MGYTKDTIAGFSWQGLFIVASTVITAGKLFVLARLLTPHDFGIFSLVAIALGITEAVTQTGINTTIIQSKESTTYFLNTAWVIAIIRGFCMALVMILIGWGMAVFYGEKNLLFWISFAALTPVVKGFINPAIISFHKNLQFFRDSLYRFALLVIEVVATVFLVWQFHSINAWIAGIIFAGICEVGISFIFLRTRPIFEYNSSRAKIIFANAQGLSISAVLSYLNDNLDNFLVGKVLGVTQLGYYQNSYALSHKVSFGVAQALSHSTFPIFSRLTSAADRLRRAFIRSILGLVGIVTLVSLPFFFFTRQLIALALGEQWLPIVPAIPWLVGAAILYGLFNLSYTLFTAKQQYWNMNVHRFFVVAIFVILFLVIGKNYGLVGAAASVFTARLLSLPFLVISVRKAIKE